MLELSFNPIFQKLVCPSTIWACGSDWQDGLELTSVHTCTLRPAGRAWGCLVAGVSRLVPVGKGASCPKWLCGSLP